MSETRPFVGIDWGSTHARALLLSEVGEILDRREAELGVKRVAPGQWPAALASLLSGWPDAGPLEVLACGMVGSRGGWVDAGYLDAPADAAALAKALVELGPLAIVPGLRARSPVDQPDVMRGEETQLLGLLDGRGEDALELPATIVLPGTHSKWVHATAAGVERFATVMTGELFELLRAHSLLAGPMDTSETGETRAGPEADADETRETRATTEADADATPEMSETRETHATTEADADATREMSEAAFERGFEASASGAPLAHELFGVRARWALGEADPDSTSYVSGLLIGTELRAMSTLFPSRTRVELVGRAALTQRYVRALDWLGITSRVHEGERAVARGLAAIQRARRST